MEGKSFSFGKSEDSAEVDQIEQFSREGEVDSGRREK